METAFSRLGDHLLRMSDGETGQRDQWVTPIVEWCRTNPDLELKKDGDFTSYENTPCFGVKDGRTFDSGNIHLQQSMYFKESYPAFKVLRDRHSQPGIRFQVGVPAPLDLPVYVFGFEDGIGDREAFMAFQQAMVAEISEILEHADDPDDVVFQIETVVAMVAVARAPAEAQEALADQMAAGLVSTAAAAPEGARFGVHLCLGDFNHRSMGEMGSARPLVLLANAVAAAWPKGRTLEYIHAPFAAAEKPGSLDEQWFEALSELDLPDDVRFVAGFIHESVDVEELRTIRDRIERLSGRQIDVAATCGLGRRPDPEQAWDAMDKAVALIEN
jgi:hypothetical protein